MTSKSSYAYGDDTDPNMQTYINGDSPVTSCMHLGVVCISGLGLSDPHVQICTSPFAHGD